MANSKRLLGQMEMAIGFLSARQVGEYFDYVIVFEKFCIDYKRTLKERLAVTTPNRVLARRVKSAERELGCKLHVAVEMFRTMMDAEEFDETRKAIDSKPTEVLIRIFEEIIPKIPIAVTEAEKEKSPTFLKMTNKIKEIAEARDYAQAMNNLKRNLECVEKYAKDDNKLKERIQKRIDKLSKKK